MTNYKPYAVEIFPDGGSSTLIGSITSQDVDPGLQVSSEATAGSSAPSFAEINEANTAGKFDTTAIATAWALIGNKGLCLSGGATPGFGIFLLKQTDCGALAAGSVHDKRVIPNCLVVPRTLSAQHGSLATLSVEVIAIYDGTNEPLIPLTGQAAPTGLPVQVGFHLGDVEIAGVTLTKKTSLELDFGLEVNRINTDGESNALSLDITKHQPKLTVNCQDVSKFGDGAGQLARTGKLGTHANSSFILRQRLNATDSFMTGTSHIKATMGGLAQVGPTTASSNSIASMTVMQTAIDDGTNDMLVVAFDHDLSA